VFGYYSLPVLVDDRIVGRVDLKSDRQNRVLRVQSAWREPGAPAEVEQRVAPLVEAARVWQGLDAIEVVDRGDLARDLAGALGLPLLTGAAAGAAVDAAAADAAPNGATPAGAPLGAGAVPAPLAGAAPDEALPGV